MKKLLLLLMISPIILFSQVDNSENQTTQSFGKIKEPDPSLIKDQGLAIGVKHSFNNTNSWIGIDFSMAFIEIGETEYYDSEGNKMIHKIIVPQQYEVLVFGYARTIDQSSTINDFSFDLVRMPAESDVPFFGRNFPNAQLNIFKFGFMNKKNNTNNVWYYRPEIGFSYGGLSLLYSYGMNFKKDIEWAKNNKHLITIRFSKIIFKY